MSFQKCGLMFREVEPRDFELLRLQRNLRWLGYRNPASVQTLKQQQAWYDSLNTENQAYIVESVGPGEVLRPVGLLRFGGFDHENRSVTITGVDVFHEGQGYATGIMRAAAEYMLHDLGYHRIVGECTEDNHGMRKAMEKADYQLEGRKRSYIWRCGKWHDFLQFSLLAEELWPEEKQQIEGI